MNQSEEIMNRLNEICAKYRVDEETNSFTISKEDFYWLTYGMDESLLEIARLKGSPNNSTSTGESSNLSKYRVFKDVNGEISYPEKINHEHEVGDVVTRHSHDNQYKCVEIVNEANSTTYIFKQGKQVYSFDW